MLIVDFNEIKLPNVDNRLTGVYNYEERSPVYLEDGRFKPNLGRESYHDTLHAPPSPPPPTSFVLT
jgi:hypothetical protein